MLRVSRIAHAGMVVETPTVRCIVDPILKNDFMGGTLELNPPISLDTAAFSKVKFDLLIISHEHEDHFSLPSIHLVNRDAHVLYPARSPWIKPILERLGFKFFRALVPFRGYKLRDLEIVATRSHVSFPEMGILFRSGKSSCWNLVDSVVKKTTIQRILRDYGRPSVVFAPFQPVIELEMFNGPLGGNFPLLDYKNILRTIQMIGSKYVVPTAFGYRNSTAEWLNTRQFPMSETQFAKDIKLMASQQMVVHLTPGSTLRIDADRLRKAGKLPYISRKTSLATRSTEWRPDRGVDPLTAKRRLSVSEMKTLKSFLRGTFLRHLNSRDFERYVKPLHLGKVVWRLEILEGPGQSSTWTIDFTKKPLNFSKSRADDFPNLHTSVLGSTLLDSLNGKCSPYSLILGRGALRNYSRFYRVNRNGAQKTCLTFYSDPLSEILKLNFFTNFMIRELNQLGA